MHYANTYLSKPVVPDVEIVGDGKTKVLKCMLNTGSDIYQGACKKRGSTLKEEYKNASGTCYMDPRDMGKLGVKNWDTVLVKTEWGEVVVNAAVSRDAPHEGTVFICKGPWANTVVSPDTYCCSDPTYKGIHCTVEKTDREVLLMADLMRWVYKKYVDSDDDDVVEHMESEGMINKFFDSREQAASYVTALKTNAIVRDANLEDVFIELTGRRVND